VGFLNIVHYVQLTNVLKVLIHRFHQIVDELQVRHFILSQTKNYLLLNVETDDEIQRSVSSVNDLISSE
jgi:hypothetical protein